jgi:hypothetical protein
MDRMTTSGDLPALTVRGYLKRLRANWPALLLPLVAAGTLGLFGAQLPWLAVILAVLLAALAPRESAKLAPFALFGYGAYGVFLAHAIAVWETQPVVYGLVHVGPADNAAWVLPQAFLCLAVGTWLLAVTGAPGGGAVRRALAQLRGTDGQPRTVPPLLLLPVILLWEEAFSSALWFTGSSWQSPLPALTVSALIIAAGVAAVVWVPRVAAVIAVGGLLLFALGGGSLSLHWLWTAGLPLNALHWRVGTMFYGAVQLAGGLELRLRGGIGVPLPGGISGVLGAAQGALLLGLGCAARAGARAAGGGAHPVAHRRDRGRGGRAAPDRAGSARRRAGPAGRGGHVAARRRAADDRQPGGGAGAGRGGARDLLAGDR